MKIKRQKKAHRYLSFFINNYGFRQPYQVLIDGTFCQAALTNKINIKEQLGKYLDGEVKLLTTACVITEAEKLGSKFYGALSIAKQFGTHVCGHEKAPGSASECLLSMLGSDNSNHYVLATQDVDLRKKARHIAGTPLLYIDYSSPLLERPSKMSYCEAESQIERKIDYQHKVLHELKKKAFKNERKVVKKIKRRMPKGPNPLSCKKKKEKVK
uniref:rRNA-processing protein UTP23 homolog n=1 Tax=Strigamia maritima TaxID=126957 RepID=T1IRT6_STRMM